MTHEEANSLVDGDIIIFDGPGPETLNKDDRYTDGYKSSFTIGKRYEYSGYQGKNNFKEEIDLFITVKENDHGNPKHGWPYRFWSMEPALDSDELYNKLGMENHND